ncbi:hypothetical protein DFH09DRAFT_1371155 [Mycena vulgaris]|nr:hypothetical protein DFH09DRAFT_1371155 [Mycena vulgaris]
MARAQDTVPRRRNRAALEVGEGQSEQRGRPPHRRSCRVQSRSLGAPSASATGELGVETFKLDCTKRARRTSVQARRTRGISTPQIRDVGSKRKCGGGVDGAEVNCPCRANRESEDVEMQIEVPGVVAALPSTRLTLSSGTGLGRWGLKREEHRDTVTAPPSHPTTTTVALSPPSSASDVPPRTLSAHRSPPATTPPQPGPRNPSIVLPTRACTIVWRRYLEFPLSTPVPLVPAPTGYELMNNSNLDIVVDLKLDPQIDEM